MRRKSEKTLDAAEERERMFSEFEVFVIKSMIAAQSGSLSFTDAQAKALSSGNLSPKVLADLTQLAGLEDKPQDLIFRVRLAAGRIPLYGNGDDAAVFAPARELAYRVWTQLKTRSFTVKVHWDEDDLLRIYDSWHAGVLQMRALCEQLPVWRDPDTRRARRVLQQVHSLLNDTVRPHLRKWHTPFRHWLEQDAMPNLKLRDLVPSKRQQEFPEFARLKTELETTQNLTCKVADTLCDLAIPAGVVDK